MTEAAREKSTVTPMMAQFLEIKTANPDCLLFYRMGDFYELFFDDAEIAARALGITLTKRGRHNGDDIPMCGVPVHSADEYLHRLIKLGHRVAVCEQTEDPAEAKKRGPKAVVRREVVRLVTPGTITEDNLLDAKRSNYLASLARHKAQGELALAWVDISTGACAVCPTSVEQLAADLARLEPSEIVLPDTLLSDDLLADITRQSGCALTPLPAAHFDSANAERRLKSFFKVDALEGYGSFSRAETAACGALIEYISLTQVGKLPAIRPPRRSGGDNTMLIDAATRANLELVRTLSGNRKGSLLSVIDETVTGGGGRLLADWLSAPLRDPDAIKDRLDAVAHFHEDTALREDVRGSLKKCPDIARALSRLSLGRGGPRDLAALRDGLGAARALATHLESTKELVACPAAVSKIGTALVQDDQQLSDLLGSVLADDLPNLARDGGFVRTGYSEDLDEARALRDESRQVIAGLQAGYAEQTDVKALKVKHNNVLGYFIEVPAQHGERLMSAPLNETFIHRQTMANATRFSTVELSELEAKISAAAGRALAMELEIFDTLVAHVSETTGVLTEIASALSKLDTFSALSELAVKQRFNRPIVDASDAFLITGGRHSVVEHALKAAGDAPFVPNNCNLSIDEKGEGRRIWLLTGPNMAGKSTFLRQNALIAILAQMGSFVPAENAHIGVVDRLFSRVGAADDLARGRSTFMVEMVETATILNQATDRSLVILDEIGRGTATFDGLSIAWAAVEHLHEINCCRALFATHFHELTTLSERLDHLANATMKVREYQGDVVFLHEVGPGATDRSYGIQVAKLAGLPEPVIARATEVLHMLESSDMASNGNNLATDLPLFSAARPQSAAPQFNTKSSEVEDTLAEIWPDELTPREALEALYALKTKLDNTS
ncbi:MAG: DNA mismatch repair protein MutS [Hyphomicrobiales bacterium]